MTTLLVLRERIKELYAVHSLAADRMIHAMVCLIVTMEIYLQVGYADGIHFIWVPILLGAAGAFLPYGLITAVSALYLLINLAAVSLEVCMVVAALMILVFCIYFVFQPGDGVIIVLVAAAFGIRLPLVAVIAVGLTGALYSVIPLVAGSVIYYIIVFVNNNLATLAASGTQSSAERLLLMLSGIAAYKDMWLVVFCMAATMICVYIIRRLSVNHAWRIAIISGALLNVVLVLAGEFMMDTEFSILIMLINAFLAAFTGLTLEFFLFHQDYSRTEYVQFEDDDYYYYVKAVPKVAVTQPEVKVRTISEQSKEYGAGGEELFTVRPDIGNTSELFTSGKDLEQTRNLFKAPVPEEKIKEETEEETGYPEEDDSMEVPDHGE